MFTYSEEQAVELEKVYPKGRTIEVYLATPHKGREFEVQGNGKIIKVDRAGVHAEVYDTHSQRDFVQILRPGHDRFALAHPAGTGLALTVQK